MGSIIFEKEETCIIEGNVKIEGNVTIKPNTIIRGNSIIKGNVILGPNVELINVEVNESSIIHNSLIKDSKIGKNVSIGPFSHLRDNSIIHDNVRIGNYVEIKNSTIGKDTKIAHLSYIGDASIGMNVNIGAGVITANYDGKNKHKTIIGNNAFIGSSSTLIAPITIEDNSFIAAGSTITSNVPESNLAIARAYQVNKKRKNTR